jgi:hypothetical protein
MSPLTDVLVVDCARRETPYSIPKATIDHSYLLSTTDEMTLDGAGGAELRLQSSVTKRRNADSEARCFVIKNDGRRDQGEDLMAAVLAGGREGPHATFIS